MPTAAGRCDPPSRWKAPRRKRRAKPVHRTAGRPSLLVDTGFAAEIHDAQDAWRAVVATAARSGVPAPGFSAALAYYDALRAERLPAALVQAQRDYFGAHTYRRTDRDGVFHTRWGDDQAERPAD